MIHTGSGTARYGVGHELSSILAEPGFSHAVLHHDGSLQVVWAFRRWPCSPRPCNAKPAEECNPPNSAPSASHRSPQLKIPGRPWKFLDSLLIGIRQATITEFPGRPCHQIPAGLVLGNGAQQARTNDSSAAPPAASPGEGGAPGCVMSSV